MHRVARDLEHPEREVLFFDRPVHRLSADLAHPERRSGALARISGLYAAHGTRGAVARELGITRRTLHRWMTEDPELTERMLRALEIMRAVTS